MQKCLFPMEYLRVTQGYGSASGSHKNTKAMDFGGKDGGIDKVYAPFTGVVKRIYTKNNSIWLESVEPVLRADGTVQITTVKLTHDNSLNVEVGDVYKQGVYIYDEGKKGATDNHVHVQVGGAYQGNGWFENKYGEWELYDEVDPRNVFMITDKTEILGTEYKGENYTFKNEKEVDFPQSYTTGIYETLEAMNVRYDATTKYDVKKVSELSKDGQANATSSDANANAQYQKGTKFTAKEIVYPTDTSVWAITPSGAVCIQGSTGKLYCKKID